MIKEEIKNLIERSIEKTKEQKKLPPDFKVPEILIEHPKNPEFGFWTTSSETVFTGLEKEEKKIATEAMIKNLYSLKESKDLIKNIKAVGPFINLYPNPEFLQSKVKEILKQDKNFGSQNIGRNKTIIIDYSSPNIAKPMHVGHLRSTIIGQAIYNIYKFLGYKVIGDNHLGDWGTQFGIMIAGYKKFKPDLKEVTIEQMLDIYVRFNKEIEKKPELQEVAKEEFKKLEDGDKENRKIWKILREKSLKEFEKIYKILGIKFDLVLGESFYEKYLKEEVESALKINIAVKNPDNSVIIPLDKIKVPFLIQKSDGATLYGTRDLATLRYRVKKFKPEKIIYVIGNEQTFYLEQLFRVAEILGYLPCNKLHHIKFGLVLDENRKKLATREGRVIDAKELISKAIDLAENIIKEKNPKLPEEERQEAAKIIGVGALKYNDLSQNRQTDIVFDWNKMLSFEGNSGPYLQYSYVRLRSILRKAGSLKNFKPDLLKEKEEIEILKELIKFPEIVQESGEKFQINLLANYLYNLAGLVNTFYEKLPVLKAEKDIKQARLALIKSATIVLRNGLNLLGIEVLEKM